MPSSEEYRREVFELVGKLQKQLSYFDKLMLMCVSVEGGNKTPIELWEAYLALQASHLGPWDTLESLVVGLRQVSHEMVIRTIEETTKKDYSEYLDYYLCGGGEINPKIPEGW